VAANSHGTLAGYLDAFDTAVDADDFSSAKKALVKAEARLESLPSTTRMSFRGRLDAAWSMLEKLEAVSTGNRPIRLLYRRGR